VGVGVGVGEGVADAVDVAVGVGVTEGVRALAVCSACRVTSGSTAEVLEATGAGGRSVDGNNPHPARLNNATTKTEQAVRLHNA
jgi:hypothetical protein